MQTLTRARLSRGVQQIAFQTGLSARLARRGRFRAVVMLHGVGGTDLPKPDFERAMRWIAAEFRVLGLNELLSRVGERRVPEPRGEVALTFDDGLRNHIEQAYPVLHELGLAATFFVCPGLIESRRWLWNHEIRARLSRVSAGQLIALAQTLRPTSPGIDGIVAWMKTLGLEQRHAAEARIREVTADFVPTAAEREGYDPLKWDDLRRLDPSLITIGSHTVDHPILSTLEDEQIEFELRRSRAWLEEAVGRPVDLFCYPNGSQDMRVRHMAAQTYRAAVSTVEGRVTPHLDWHAIPRVPIAAHLPLFAWRMHRPGA
ncbi:MAG: polysaccharide deacetylase family protein [Proteobacteria bacterium]|nr:polysaccharide deacetylase family protein [Pseudomonadota bacterium]